MLRIGGGALSRRRTWPNASCAAGGGATTVVDFPSGYHNGGHGLLMVGVQQDPTNQTKRVVYPQI